MLMKVFNKGQVVIPAGIRKDLGIRTGDRLEVTTDPAGKTVMLRKPKKRNSARLGGSLSRYAEGKPFPTRGELNDALKNGLANE